MYWLSGFSMTDSLGLSRIAYTGPTVVPRSAPTVTAGSLNASPG